MKTSPRTAPPPALAAVALSLLATACTAPASSELTDITVHPAALEDSELCEPPYCPGNAATIGDGIVFSELDSAGVQPNAGGVKIVGVVAPVGNNQMPVSVRVDRHELVAVALHDSRIVIRGKELAGTVVTLERCGAQYKLLIEQVHGQGLSFLAGPPDAVPSYTIRYAKTRTGTPSCAPGEKLQAKFEESICLGSEPEDGTLFYRTIVFRGDRYDSSNLVSPIADGDSPPNARPPGPDWFNLACAGSGMWKMHLLRHTRAGRIASDGKSYLTDLDQRQAMLRMLPADYCGTARSFTRNGHPLFYADSNDWYPQPKLEIPDSRISSVDGIWNADGAVCVGTPRRSDVTPEQIKEECLNAGKPVPPPCGDATDWRTQGHVISANP
jgi:hypothetical protein